MALPAEALAPEELRRSLTDTLMAALHRLKRDGVRIAASFDLSFAQARALRTLRQPLSMRELADRLQLDPSNVTGVVDALERRGLVERQVDPGDRRVKRLVLTKEGLRLGDEVEATLLERSVLFAELSLDEQRELLHLLARVVEAPESD
jgi:DNA-binding MarR family transcriptional regulator